VLVLLLDPGGCRSQALAIGVADGCYAYSRLGIEAIDVMSMAFTVTKDLMLPATVTGSWPRPRWYTANLWGRPLDTAMMDPWFASSSPTPTRSSLRIRRAPVWIS
jgi:hypothetical protein